MSAAMDLKRKVSECESVVCLRARVRPLLVFGCGCVFLASILCLSFSYMFHYDLAQNMTWCGEGFEDRKNQLVSLSMSFGVYSPEKHIWLFLAILHFPLRIIFGFFYEQLFLKLPHRYGRTTCFRIMARLMTSNYLGEVFGVIILTVFDIESSFVLHGVGFIVVLFCLGCYQFWIIILSHLTGWRRHSPTQGVIFWVRVFLFLAHAALCFSAAGTYHFYDQECQIWAHSHFTLVEYVVFYMNILFHFLPFWDVPEVHFGLAIEFNFLPIPNSDRYSFN